MGVGGLGWAGLAQSLVRVGTGMPARRFFLLFFRGPRREDDIPVHMYNSVGDLRICVQTAQYCTVEEETGDMGRASLVVPNVRAVRPGQGREVREAGRVDETGPGWRFENFLASDLGEGG
ncbi:hypothetical protein BT67DRAFT_443040 [Trichocladium antarcticum]|uniref:Uncharacterized protein n=1 Tax=Trichocladium antarcticum TaxID=1450529 RepID=A0AAN6ZCQ2_9PEZI|nr:hypothetical protein BT67DRAFT_443040 [Trichocladium antarcticum]